jgi:hypothetical protein
MTMNKAMDHLFLDFMAERVIVLDRLDCAFSIDHQDRGLPSVKFVSDHQMMSVPSQGRFRFRNQ